MFRGNFSSPSEKGRFPLNSGISGNRISNVIIKYAEKYFSPEGNWYQNEDIHQILYGSDWKNVLKSRGLDSDYYKKTYGYEKRHMVRIPGRELSGIEPTSADLMEGAAVSLFRKNRISRKNIGLLIAVSTTSHRYTTSLGAVLSGRLGLKCASYELKSGCASGIYALFNGAQTVSLTGKDVLILSGETLSKTAAGELFYHSGDAGAAVLLSHSENKDAGIHSFYLDSDGQYSEQMGVQGILPPSEADFHNQNYTFRVSPLLNEKFIQFRKKIPGVLYRNSEISSDMIEYMITNQAGRKMNSISAKAAGISYEKFLDLSSENANCGQTGLFLSLEKLLNEKKIQEDKYIMMNAVGGGISCGGLIWKT